MVFLCCCFCFYFCFLIQSRQKQIREFVTPFSKFPIKYFSQADYAHAYGCNVLANTWNQRYYREYSTECQRYTKKQVGPTNNSHQYNAQ